MKMSTSLTSKALERVRYFPRQLITAEDMTDEQHFFIRKLRRHNQVLHGWGVVCGCDVRPHTADGHPWRVRVCTGHVVDPCGNDIHISREVDVDLADPRSRDGDPCAPVWPCPPLDARVASDDTSVCIAVRYVECVSRPVRVHPVGCACDEADCDYSRTRDDFEVRVLRAVPESHAAAKARDDGWCEKVKKWAKPGLPVPDCPADLERSDDGWVVLACVEVTAGADDTVTDAKISYADRRVLYGAHAFHLFMMCQP